MSKNSDYYKELLQLSYENDKTVRGIIRFSGLSEFFRHFVSERVKDIRLERSKTFFDELQKKEIQLSEGVIKSEDFLHKFFITFRAAINTRQREKIEMFARLLNSSFENNPIEQVNIYEDYLNILDELSYREIQALVLLDSFYTVPREDDENNNQWVNKYWEEFKDKLQEKINIEEENINDFMIRLSRSGLYDTFSGEYYFGATKGKGMLTPTFEDMKSYILDQ